MILLVRLIDLYVLVVLAAAFASWIAPTTTNPVLGILRSITEPVFRIFRPIIPRLGGVDASPVLVILLLEVVKYVLLRLT